MSENRIPINRLNKFFSSTDFDFNIDLGMEYLHGDINMKLVLYRVDHNLTSNDEVYAEVGKDEIIFLPPVEFNGLVKFDDSKNNSYKGGLVRYNEPGNMIISVYIKHLEELDIDIKYGDFISYSDDEDTLRYYSVSNDGKILSHNKNKMFGYKPHYRTITCVPAQPNEFRGL